MTLTVRQPSTRERVWPSPALLSEVWGTGDHSRFTDEGTEARGIWVMCPGSQS